MFDAFLGVATGVPVAFVKGQPIGFAAIHTPVQGPTPTRTGLAPNTQPVTMPPNQANQLDPPPPLPLSRTDSSASGSGVNTTTGTRTVPQILVL